MFSLRKWRYNKSFDQKTEKIFLQKRQDIISFEKIYLPLYAPPIYPSSCSSFNTPFQFLHGDIADINLLAKSAADPKNCLLIVNIFTLKTLQIQIEKSIQPQRNKTN